MGAAQLAGLAAGYWDSLDEIRRNWGVDRIFQPELSEEARITRLKGWQKAVRCASGWEIP